MAKIELVRTTLHGFPKSWEVFVEGIVAREHLPDWASCGMIVCKMRFVDLIVAR